MAAASAALLPAQNPDLARDAFRVLTERCARCHGSAVEKPDGEFGDVQRASVLRERWIQGKSAEESELWSVIVDGPMPPEGEPESPLPASDLEILRAWIAAGAPDFPAATTPDEVPLAPPVVDPIALRGFWPVLLGRSHVVLVHFPIALLIVAAFAELLALVRPKDRAALRSVVRFALWIGALSAVAASASGWAAAAIEGYRDAKVFWHRWLGVGTSVLAIASLIACEATQRSPRAGALWLRILLLGALALLTAWTGHLGGELVHGAEHFAFLGLR